MRHNITSKPAENWNPFLLEVYVRLPYPINEVVWKIEQLVNPDANGLLLPTDEDEDYAESFDL